MSRSFLVGAAVSLSCFTGLAIGGEKRQHKAHEHGHGKLNVVVDQGTLSIDLDAPMNDVVGFEHKPRNDKERTELEHVMTTLKAAAKCFALPAEAACTVKNASAEMEQEAKGHADINAKYEFMCANPAALKAIDVLMFKEFSRMKRLEVQVVGAQGQKSQELTPTKSNLTL